MAAVIFSFSEGVERWRLGDRQSRVGHRRVDMGRLETDPFDSFNENKNEIIKEKKFRKAVFLNKRN